MAQRSASRRMFLPSPPFLYSFVLGSLVDLLKHPSAEDQRACAVLLQTCLGRASLERVVRQTCARSATAVRAGVEAVLAALSPVAWEAAFNQVLQALALPLLRGRRVVLVGDETHLPFWGRKGGELADELRGGPPKQGAVRFFAYVTICALWRGRRIVVAVGRWRAQEPLAAVLDRLAPPLLASGLQIESWLWDRGGATVAMVDWWRRHEQKFIVAAPRRGPKHGVAARLNALEATWGHGRRQPPPVTESYTLQPEKSSGLAPATVCLVIAWERVKKRPGERRQRSLRRSAAQRDQVWRAVAWFTDGGDWRGCGGAVQALYRQRQSIESSYRVSHASRGRTSSRDARYRFVLFAISQLLQAVWSWLHWQASLCLNRRQHKAPLLLVDLIDEWLWCGRQWLMENLARPAPKGGQDSGWEASGAGV